MSLLVKTSPCFEAYVNSCLYELIMNTFIVQKNLTCGSKQHARHEIGAFNASYPLFAYLLICKMSVIRRGSFLSVLGIHTVILHPLICISFD